MDESNLCRKVMPHVLLIVDVQKGLDEPYWGQRNNPDAEQNMKQLLQTWRRRDWPVIHVKHLSTNPHSPLQPGLPGNDIKQDVYPLEGEVVFEKTVNSAFIGTGLEAYLHQQEWEDLVIVGLTTNHCISSTVRMAANLGFKTTVVSDATAAHQADGIDGAVIPPEIVHQVSLASLQGEFATVLPTDRLLERLHTA